MAAPPRSRAEVVNRVVVRPEQRLNAQLEKEVKRLADNFMDIVASAKLGDKEQATLAREMYETDVHTNNIVRSAEALLLITHELKRALLLNDVEAIGEDADQRRQALDQALQRIDADALEVRADVAAGLHSLEHAYNVSSCK